MTQEAFKAVETAYYNNPCPTRADFKRYTHAFFAWVDSAIKRFDANHPELRVKKLPPLPLFETAKAKEEVAA